MASLAWPLEATASRTGKTECCSSWGSCKILVGVVGLVDVTGTFVIYN
jgi:hypothetical protein